MGVKRVLKADSNCLGRSWCYYHSKLPILPIVAAEIAAAADIDAVVQVAAATGFKTFEGVVVVFKVSAIVAATVVVASLSSLLLLKSMLVFFPMSLLMST